MGLKSDLLNELNRIEENIYKCNLENNHWLNQLLKDYIERVKSQQRTIDCLTDALCGKYEHGLFILTAEDSTKPIVIKHGQVLTDKYTTSVDVCWNYDCAPIVTIER